MTAQVHRTLQDAGPAVHPTPCADPPFTLLSAALREHAERVLVVPGKPVHLLADELPGDAVIEVTDEKSGFEQAMGMAFAGVPVAVLYKGVGISHAWDSIANAVVHGTVDGRPVLLVAADDPTAEASTVIVDSRALAATADLAVIEPCTASHVAPAVELAATMSATVGEPVMVRYTPELEQLTPATSAQLDGSGTTVLPVEIEAGSSLVPPKIVPMPGQHRAHGMTKPGRHLHRERFSIPVLTAMVEGAGLLDHHDGSRVLPRWGRTAIVGFGAAWSAAGRPAAEALDIEGMGSSVLFPLPERLVELASRFDTVLVVEDGRPVGEAALALALHDAGARTTVIGRRRGRDRTRALPAVGQVTEADVHRALGGGAVDERVPLWKEGGKGAVAPYDTLFDAVAAVRRRHGVSVATCVGTVIDVAGAPWRSVDLALSLGAATGAAAGIAEAGRVALALIGDYGLLHSGLNAYGLIQRRELPVLSIVVANGVSKRTGGQRSAFHPDEPGAFDLLGELAARGARTVRVLDGDALDVSALITCIEAELDRLPATIVIESGDGFHRSAVAHRTGEATVRRGGGGDGGAT